MVAAVAAVVVAVSGVWRPAGGGRNGGSGWRQTYSTVIRLLTLTFLRAPRQRGLPAGVFCRLVLLQAELEARDVIIHQRNSITNTVATNLPPEKDETH